MLSIVSFEQSYQAHRAMAGIFPVRLLFLMSCLDLTRYFYRSVRPALGRIIVNVDVTVGVVYVSSSSLNRSPSCLVSGFLLSDWSRYAPTI